MGDIGIIIQPPSCAATGSKFSGTVLPCLLKCGCCLSTKEVARATTETGFVYCNVCEFSYSVKSKAALLTDNRVLQPKHLAAQEKRCAFFEEEISKLQSEVDIMITEVGIKKAEEEDQFDFIDESDPSSVSDESGLEEEDHISFAATDYALFSRRLLKLKARRNAMKVEKKDKLALGKQLNAPWAHDGSWRPAAEEVALILAEQARRSGRRQERKGRYARRRRRTGAAKVVHNVHVLDNTIPRKWRNADPNALPAPDFAAKQREKQGWLTEQEQEDMDDDEQVAATEKRREEWRAQQSKVPQIVGSIKRQRWADRLYKIARRRHYFAERMEGLNGTDEAQLEVWKNVLATHEARLVSCQAQCAARCLALEAQSRFEEASTLQALFAEAARIGEVEIAAEIEARRKAEEATRLAAQAEEAARVVAEEKAKAKAEAEARGEVWVDPEAAEDEGDEDED